ncbi:MAG: LysR family transcriptional regulator [Polyangiaceae bacterium]
MIQIARLEGFFRVARAGGYTRAAKDFPYPITQPGIHQQVSKLEGELGVRLFVRRGRDQMELTDAGRTLFDFCAPFFDELPLVVERAITGGQGGTLRVDAAALEIRHVLPPWFRALRERKGNLRIRLEEVPCPDTKRLVARQADVVVDFFPDIPRGFASRRIGEHRIFLVAPSRHPKARGKRMTVADFAGEPLVTFPPNLPHTERQLRAVESVAPADQVLTASSTDAILGFVAAGLGYSLVPWPTPSGPKVPGVRAEPVRGPGTRFPIHAVWLEGGSASRLVEEALRALPATTSA